MRRDDCNSNSLCLFQCWWSIPSPNLRHFSWVKQSWQWHLVHWINCNFNLKKPRDIASKRTRCSMNSFHANKMSNPLNIPTQSEMRWHACSWKQGELHSRNLAMRFPGRRKLVSVTRIPSFPLLKMFIAFNFNWFRVFPTRRPILLTSHLPPSNRRTDRPLFEGAHYGTKPGHFETSIIHFPTSSGVSKVSERANEWAQRGAQAKRAFWSKQMSERCKRTSEWTSEWPGTADCIFGCFRP